MTDLWITVGEHDDPEELQVYGLPPTHFDLMPDGSIGERRGGGILDNPLHADEALESAAGVDPGFCRRVAVLRAPYPYELKPGVWLLSRSRADLKPEPAYLLLQVLSADFDAGTAEIVVHGTHTIVQVAKISGLCRECEILEPRNF